MDTTVLFITFLGYIGFLVLSGAHSCIFVQSHQQSRLAPLFWCEAGFYGTCMSRGWDKRDIYLYITEQNIPLSV